MNRPPTSAEPVFSRRNPWFTVSVAITAALVLAAALVGFVWLPMLQPQTRLLGLWGAICSAAGALGRLPATGPVVEPGYRVTAVVFSPGMFRDPSPDSIGRGATLALRCTMCHGARGLSDANSPNLAGQYAAVVYKQLRDFKSGARASAIMAPLVVDLSDRDMRDLAAYYAYLPRPQFRRAGDRAAPRIVAGGAPMRNIPPCGACHGELDDKTGSPWLGGQPADYLRAQLLAFASGARHNDISEQMRNVVRRMSPSEIAAAARYYGAAP